MEMCDIYVPEEILSIIIDYLDTPSLMCVSKVCRQLSRPVEQKRIRILGGTVTKMTDNHAKHGEWENVLRCIEYFQYVHIQKLPLLLFLASNDGMLERVIRSIERRYKWLEKDLDYNNLLSIAIQSRNKLLLDYLYERWKITQYKWKRLNDMHSWNIDDSPHYLEYLETRLYTRCEESAFKKYLDIPGYKK